MSRSLTKNSGKSDFAYFITSDLPLKLIRKMLSLKKMSDSEVENVVERVNDVREKVRNLVRKFNRKLKKRYGDVDTVEFVKKGMKAAKKAGLGEAETKLFLRQAMYGESGAMIEEKKKRELSQMGKFLGYSAPACEDDDIQILDISSSDFPKLNELKAHYDSTQMIHTHVKDNMFNYRDCAAEALSGVYDKTRHNVHSHIHPLFVALFLPKIKYLERRMLLTNIARMILSRGQVYLKNSMFHLKNNVAPTELDAEMELAEDIASDPNSLEHFRDHSPLSNLLKRYKCQVELYKTVLALRTGQFYSARGSDEMNALVRVLNKQDWVFYDAVEFNTIQDEGTVLRKLLAVFSVRPTLSVLSTYSQKFGIVQNSYLAKTKFKYLPIINVKLPLDVNSYGSVTSSNTFSLSQSLSQSDNFVEKGLIVPKKKSIVFSNGVVFFYVNRHNTSPTFTQLNVKINMRNIALPAPKVTPNSRYNKTLVDFDDSMRIGKETFNLRSAVYFRRKPLNGMDIYTGCVSAVVHRDDSGAVSYFQYSPLDASIMVPDTTVSGATQYRSNDPITFIPEYDLRPNGVGFRKEAGEKGTIFVYSNC